MFARFRIDRQPVRTDAGIFDADNAPGDAMASDIRALVDKARKSFGRTAVKPHSANRSA